MANENLPDDLSKATPEQLNSLGDKWGQKLQQIKPHQLRNLYSAVQRIRVRAEQPGARPEEINRRLIFLKPRLAYASGRQEGRDKATMKDLRDLLVKAIDGVTKSEDPKKARDNFFFLMEAIVAYHKFYGKES